MPIFFELHYYDGGLKTELVPDGPRPDFLPEPPGPRSTELEVHDGEFAAELLCSNLRNHRVVWIGLYTFSVDQQHGARGNYCGAGVWLVDLVPIQVNRILNNLSALALRISKDGAPGRELLESLKKAARNSDELGWGVAFDRWPPVLSSAPFNSSNDGSSIFLTSRRGDKFDLRLVAADILHQFTRKPKGGEPRARRRLYLMRESSKLPENSLLEFDCSSVLAVGEKAIAEFCEATAEPMARQNALLEDQRKEAKTHAAALADARSKLAAQTQRAKQLQAALNASEEQRSAMQETFAAVRRFMAESGDTNTAGFATRVEDIYHVVRRSQSMLDQMGRRASGRMPAALPATFDQNGEPEIGQDEGDPAPSHWGLSSGRAQEERQDSSSWNWIDLLLASIMVAAVVIFGLWNYWS